MALRMILSRFAAGALAANAIPHLVHGVSGKAFQTPFATPPAKGRSRAPVNVLWAGGNLALAWAVGRRARLGHGTEAAPFALGALAMALTLAWQFGRINGGDRPHPPTGA